VFARTHGAVQSYVSWFPVSTSTTDETVVAADQSGYVYAINALDGTVRWSKKLGADGFQAAVSVQLNHTYFTTDAWRAAYAASPYFYTGDVVFVATRNTSDTLNEVFALRATDGTQLWKYTPATSMDKVLAQPYVDYQRNRLYIAGLAGFDGSQLSLRVIDSTDGTEIACDACAALGDIETAPSQSFDYTTLYVGTKAGMIHAIALDTLQSKWTSPFSTAGKRVKSLIWEDWDTAGKLYFVAEGPTADEVWSIQDDGAQATTVFTRTPIAAGRLAQPVIGDSSTYPYMWIGGSDGKLYQLRLSDGQSLTEAGAPQAAFTVGDGTKTLGDVSTDDVTGVYVGTSGGTFYKIQLPLP
jgi:outer membrane protein assembly factor BamB